jgi:hypothetical protein
MSHRFSCIFMILCAVIGGPAYAWEKQWNEAPAIQDSCLSYDGRYSEAPLFRIAAKADPKIHFFTRKESCAERAGSSCPARMKAYLVDGDVVFGGPEDGNFRCVYYGTAKGTIVAGFIPADNLAPFVENEDLTQDFLVGTWTHAGNPEIVITAVGENKVSADGEASWPGVGKQARNTGGFSAVGSPAGKEITFREGDDTYSYRVALLRRGPYLVAKDNSYCGGMNVRFSGILMKVHAGK